MILSRCSDETQDDICKPMSLKAIIDWLDAYYSWPCSVPLSLCSPLTSVCDLQENLFILEERQKVRLAVERLGLSSVSPFNPE